MRPTQGGKGNAMLESDMGQSQHVPHLSWSSAGKKKEDVVRDLKGLKDVISSMLLLSPTQPPSFLITMTDNRSPPRKPSSNSPRRTRSNERLRIAPSTGQFSTVLVSPRNIGLTQKIDNLRKEPLKRSQVRFDIADSSGKARRNSAGGSRRGSGDSGSGSGRRRRQDSPEKVYNRR